MNWVSVLIYLISLPFAVYVYASCLSLLDRSSKIVPLARIVACGCLLLALAIVTSRTFLEPVLWAIGSVVLVHWTGFFVARHLMLGMPIYANTPPPRDPDAAEHSEDNYFDESFDHENLDDDQLTLVSSERVERD